jgi:hypothetical protein
VKAPRSRGSQFYLLQLLAVAVGLVLVAVGHDDVLLRVDRRADP